MNKKIIIKSSANMIKEKVRNNDEVLGYVNEILNTIQNAIEDSIEQERNFCIVKVCSMFSISFLSPKQAKRDIYFLTHQTLIQAGYIVNIKYIGESLYESDSTYFKIKWETDFDDDINNKKVEYLERVSEKVVIDKNKKNKKNKNK